MKLSTRQNQGTTHIQSRRRRLGFSLSEVLMSISISAITIVSIVTGYINSAERAEWTAANAAANSLAQQRIEQVKAAKWDVQAYPVVDELTSANFPVNAQPLDMPLASTNCFYGTNTTTITTVSANPPIRMIRVDCTWRFMNRATFTNTIVVYRSAEQ